MASTRAALFVLLLCSAVLAQQKPVRALLDLRVNEEDKGEVLVYIGDSDILIRVDDLKQAGIPSVAGSRKDIQGEKYVSLASLAPDLSYKFNETSLLLSITARPELLGSSVQLNLRGARPSDITYSHDTSGFMNYALNIQNFTTWSAFTETGISWHGDLLYSSLMRNSQGQLIRGLTNLTVNKPDAMTSWVAGDRLANSPDSLGGASFLGGLSYMRNFSLDPYFVSFPSQNLAGALTTPSTLDIYVNGRLVRQEELPPGQFQLNNIPGGLGSGNTQVVIRDAFGNLRTINSPYYLSSQVLQHGLSEFGYSLGLQRNDLQSSFTYGQPTFIGFHRYGLTNWLTPGFRVEAQSKLLSAGPMLDLRTPWGQVEAAGSASISRGQLGAAAWLAYSYVTEGISFGANLKAMSSRYSVVNLRPTDDRNLVQAAVFIGRPITEKLSIFPQYSYTLDRDSGRRDQISTSLNYRLSERMALISSVNWTRQQGFPASTGVQIALSYFLGHSTSATLAYNHQTQGSEPAIELQRSLPVGPGYGYRVSAQTGTQGNQLNGDFQYQSRYGLYEFNYLHDSGQGVSTDTELLNISGGVAAIGGRVFATRAVQDGFGLIRVPDVPNVAGYFSNQYIGKTDSRGDLLIPNLIPYYGNQVSINDKDIPLDHAVDATVRTVATSQRGGAVIAFPVHRIQAFIGKLEVKAGGRNIVPKLGEFTVKANGKDYTSPIGNGGEFYLENIPPGSLSALIAFKDGECRFNIDLPESKEPFVKLGTLTCNVDLAAVKEKP